MDEAWHEIKREPPWPNESLPPTDASLQRTWAAELSR